MSPPHRLAFDGEIPRVVKDSLTSGLLVLWRAFEYARDLDAAILDFAVDEDTLHHAGLSAIDLRWLIARGFVEAFANSTGNQPVFVLTRLGYRLAHEVLSETIDMSSSRTSSKLLIVAPKAISTGKTIPTWDYERRELRCGESLIKRFRWAAANQETILAAYEEEGWPIRIDDPLPQKVNQSPKSRLHDTIKCLNRNHENRLIHFSGDGTGEGVLWRFL